MLSNEELDAIWQRFSDIHYVDRKDYEKMKAKAEELAEENVRLKQNKAYTESPLVMLIDYLKRIDELETKVAKLEVELAKTQSDVRSVGYPQW